jgi:hypothetical protein
MILCASPPQCSTRSVCLHACFVAVVVQGHRFDILEDVGCYPAIVNTSLTYFLMTLWPIFIGVASFVFTIMNISYICRHRHALDSWMECTPSTLLTSPLYIRLVILGLIAFGLTSALSIRDLVSQITAGSVTWPGWEVVHADFGRVDQIPRGIWAGHSGFGAEFRRWVSVLCALAAFFVLGTTREAGERYRTFGRMILRLAGGKAGQKGEGSGDLKRCVRAPGTDFVRLTVFRIARTWSNLTTRTKRSCSRSSRNTTSNSPLHPRQTPLPASHPLPRSHARLP